MNFNSGDWDSEVRFIVRDPDGTDLYDSGYGPFEGLNYLQYVYLVIMKRVLYYLQYSRNRL